MESLSQFSKFDWTVAPSRTPVTDVAAKTWKSGSIQAYHNNSQSDAAKSTKSHVHMKVGSVQSHLPDEPSPPPIPPRLSQPSSKVAQSPHRGPITSSRRANPTYGTSTGLQTARRRGKAMNEARRQRYMSAPLFEEWSLRSEAKHSVDQATIQPSTSENGDHSAAMTLNQFVLQYSHMLPMRVKIVQGCGSMLHTGKLYNIHFVKQLKVVQVKDMAGCQYSIPFNSSARFGVVYSPAGIRNECYVFEKVKDIIDAAELPKVVVATKSVRLNSDHSIRKNEVLIVQEVRKSQLRMNQKLKVFSYTAKVQKHLLSDTYGNFTTDPSKAPLYLPELLKLFQNLLPLKARLYPDISTENSLPDILSKEVITLERVSTETSLIASALSDSGLAEETVELKTSLPVTVLTETMESEILYDYTQTLFRNFNQAKVATLTSYVHRDNRGRCETLPAQEQLYQQVRNADGVSIIPPKSPINDQSSSENHSVSPPEHEYQPLNLKELYDSCYEPISISPTCSSACSDVFASPTSESMKVVHTEDFEELKEQCSVTVSEVNQLKSEVAYLKQQMAALVEMSVQPRNEDASNWSKNIKQLRALDNSKILELLDIMKLNQYNEVFSSECITGEILADFDDNILETELCITKRIHRMRLMKIIRGQVSVTSFFSS